MKLDFCVACGAKKDLHNHHLLPRVKGGSDDEKNLITLCHPCHRTLHGVFKDSWGNHSELTRAGVQAKKDAGKQWVSVLYGWDFDDDGKARKNKEEQKAIRLMMRMRAKGETFSAIADELNTRGIPTKNPGATWVKGTVHRIYHRTKKGPDA